jgi:hypothetical protein
VVDEGPNSGSNARFGDWKVELATSVIFGIFAIIVTYWPTANRSVCGGRECDEDWIYRKNERPDWQAGLCPTR